MSTTVGSHSLNDEHLNNRACELNEVNRTIEQ